MVRLNASDPLPAPPAETIATLNAMSLPAAIIGPDHRLVHVNPAYQSRFGSGERDVCGLPCYQVFRKRGEPCDGEENPCPVKEALLTGKPFMVEHKYFLADGREVTLQVEGTPLRDEEGNVTRVLKIIELPARKG